jgi:cation:H+ antiporter
MAVLSPTQTITRPMGYVLVTGLALYLYTSYRWARADRELNEQLEEVVEETPDKPLWFSLVSLVIGLIVLVLGSELMVPSASLIAGRLGVPEAVIAATVVAFGTSLPELMTAIASIRKGQPDIILGNVLGADALNILFVVGASASAAPLKVGPVFYQIQAPVMILVVILFQVYIFTTKKHFRRWQGLVLLACYVAFVVLQYIKVGVEI